MSDFIRLVNVFGIWMIRWDFETTICLLLFSHTPPPFFFVLCAVHNALCPEMHRLVRLG